MSDAATWERHRAARVRVDERGCHVWTGARNSDGYGSVRWNGRSDRAHRVAYMPSARKAFGGEGSGPCNYAGGGLFALNPVTVTRRDGGATSVFAFAEVEGAST